MNTALMLWESCCIPSMLHRAGSWVEITQATEKRLNTLQCWFVRLVLQIGPGSPLAGLLWDNALLDFGLRIWIEKIMLVFHIRSLDSDTLANRVYIEQKEKGWPGLYQETSSICKQLDIEDVNNTRLCKTKYKSILIEACHRKNEVRLRAQASDIKCLRLKKEKYGKKEYLDNQNITNTRNWFKTRYGLLPFSGNFSHDRRFAKSDWFCCCKETKEDESHLVSGNCEV